MRWLALAPLVAALAAVSSPQASGTDAGGCTICECGAAYCEGNRTFIPHVRFLQAPAEGEPGEEAEFRVELFLQELDGNATSRGPWGTRDLFLAVSPESIPSPYEVSEADGGFGTYHRVAENVSFPSNSTVTLRLAGEGPWHVRAFAGEWQKVWSEEAVVQPAPQPSPEPERFRDPPGGESGARGVPAAGPFVVVAALLGCACLARRRLLR